MLGGLRTGGEAVCFVLPDGRTISYRALIARSSQFANALVAAGVSPGDRVAVQIEKSWESIALYLATIRAGAVFLPLNTAYTPAEVSYFLSDAEPRIFVCDPARESSLAESSHDARIMTMSAAGAGSLPAMADTASREFATVERSGDDLAAILYTSGTTGRSKGAMLTHSNLASNAKTLVTAWQFTKADRLIHALPIFHTHGLFVACNVTLACGSSMIFLPGFSVDEIFRFLPEATCLMGVPTFYTRLLQDSRLNREATAGIRLFVSGSAPLLAETHDEWRARTGHAILERYGMSETNMNTSNPYEGERIAGTVGLPLPGVTIRITDLSTGEVKGVGEVGAIEVAGPNVFSGYWRMPEKTAAEFRGEFFNTGDVGVIDQRGYVSIVGRTKDLIISGGYNIYPKEVESEIDALEGVMESAVIGLPHPDFGEAVTAVVVLKPGCALTEEFIKQELSQRLARFKVPKRISFVKELPRNVMGKVQKNVLRESATQIGT
ncbi:MAG: malonyl-CoA synthase [Rhizobiaceae bacterium]|nr:malonyl-CoA synthase [Rhizobiaceae bacterium]